MLEAMQLSCKLDSLVLEAIRGGLRLTLHSPGLQILDAIPPIKLPQYPRPDQDAMLLPDQLYAARDR